MLKRTRLPRQAVRGDVSSDDLQKWIDIGFRKKNETSRRARIKARVIKNSWKSPSEIIRIVTDQGRKRTHPSRQTPSGWQRYGNGWN
jgi:hypothetical protein